MGGTNLPDQILAMRGSSAIMNEDQSARNRRVLAVGRVIPAIVAATVPLAAQAQSFADPAGSGPIQGAVRWLQGTLLGTVATVAAVIAVASIGFMMLTGRMNWRHGTVVILGCFILFGAASIVAGIQQAAGSS
jgi:type IV secretion system protein VirB2